MIYKDDLERVYALIEKPENWTQGYFARDARGAPIDEEYDFNEEGDHLTDYQQATHPEAVC